MRSGRWNVARSTWRPAAGARLHPKRHGLVPSDQSDDGFSFVEVIVAIGIFAVVLMLISGMLAGGMRGVLLGKRREVAAQEATKVVELARSLDFEHIGLVQADATIGTDPDIIDLSGVKSYLINESAATYENIVWSASTSNHPFNPHQTTFKRGATTLTRYVYVTAVDTNADSVMDYKRVTVRITWDNSGTGGSVNEVRSQTFIDEDGLVPVSPPGSGGLTPITANATASGGGFAVRTARGDLTAALDAVLPVDPVKVNLPQTSGENELRAWSTVGCSGTSTMLQGATNTYGGHGVTAQADSDAASATPEESSDDTSGMGPDSITGGGDVDEVVVESAISSPMECLASVHHDDGVTPVAKRDPYERGAGTGPATLTLAEDISGAGLGVDVLTILGMATTSVEQSIDHEDIGPDEEVREIRVDAAASFGEVEVMKIPGVFSDGLVQIDAFDFDASVVASHATPTSAPAVNVPTLLTVRIYDPASLVPGCTSRSGGYCVVVVDPTADGFAGFSRSLDSSELQNLGLTTLTYQIDVNALPPSQDPLNGVTGLNGETTWQAQYTAVSVSVRLKIEVDALLTTVLLTDSQVDLTLGTVSAYACRGIPC